MGRRRIGHVPPTVADLRKAVARWESAAKKTAEVRACWEAMPETAERQREKDMLQSLGINRMVIENAEASRVAKLLARWLKANHPAVPEVPHG